MINRFSTIIGFTRRHKHVIALVFMAFLSHQVWFNPNATLFSWDFGLRSIEIIKSHLPFGRGIFLNYFNYGSFYVTIGYNIYKIFWSTFGLNYSLLVPTALLSFLSPYFLGLHLTKNKNISFVASLFFAFSVSLMFLQLSHIPIAFSYALAPLLLLLAMKLLESYSWARTITFAIVFSISVWYEARIAYIMVFVLFFYLLFFLKVQRSLEKQIENCALCGPCGFAQPLHHPPNSFQQ